MVQFKIEEREEQIYYGYSWKCNSETDFSVIWNKFYTKEKNYLENPFVIKTLPNENEEFTYSICIQGYDSDDDLSDYDIITMPKGRYVRLLLTGPLEQSVIEGWKFAFSTFNLASEKNIELYGRQEKTSSDFFMNILIPILNEKTKIEKLKWKAAKLWEKPSVKVATGLIVATAVTAITAIVINKSQSNCEIAVFNNEENDDINLEDTPKDGFKEDEGVVDAVRSERKSPEDHIVNGHYQTYHTKHGPIKKYVEPYHRGERFGEDIEFDNFDELDDGYEDETLDVYDVAEIWASRGKDEDYTFGYSEAELEDALNNF